MKNKPKIIVVVGPTATGKSALAVRLARAIGGEVISADSRQIYRDLDIGAGKITPAEMKGVPHHLLDIASPKRTFTVAQFQKAGQKVLGEILSRGHVPIICGGSGFYVQALVDGTIFPEVLPNPKLRAELEKKTPAELCRILKKLDPRRYRKIDQANPRRLVRAIEIAKALGKVPKMKKASADGSLFNPLFIGLTLPPAELKVKIKKRLDARVRQGMIAEVKRLHASGVSWKRLESFGLEYRAIATFLQKKSPTPADPKAALEKLATNIGQFAKRQMTWFKRDKRIQWFAPKDWVGVRKIVDEFVG